MISIDSVESKFFTMEKFFAISTKKSISPINEIFFQFIDFSMWEHWYAKNQLSFLSQGLCQGNIEAQDFLYT